ncbi:MAG: hypothetical protein NVS3B1_12570 [Marmoricola sp.]
MNFTYDASVSAAQKAAIQEGIAACTFPLDQIPTNVAISVGPTSGHGGKVEAYTTVYPNGTATILFNPLLFDPRSAIYFVDHNFILECVAHELGHVVTLAMPDSDLVNFAPMFGFNFASDWSAASWRDAGKEAVAETFKDAFMPTDKRDYWNRTHRQLHRGQLNNFVALCYKAIKPAAGSAGSSFKDDFSTNRLSTYAIVSSFAGPTVSGGVLNVQSKSQIANRNVACKGGREIIKILDSGGAFSTGMGLTTGGFVADICEAYIGNGGLHGGNPFNPTLEVTSGGDSSTSVYGYITIPPTPFWLVLDATAGGNAVASIFTSDPALGGAAYATQAIPLNGTSNAALNAGTATAVFTNLDTGTYDDWSLTGVGAAAGSSPTPPTLTEKYGTAGAGPHTQGTSLRSQRRHAGRILGVPR